MSPSKILMSIKKDFEKEWLNNKDPEQVNMI